MKKENWHVEFNQLLKKCRNKLFRTGVYDCALFMSDAVLIMTDKDPAETFRGNYTTDEQANALLEDYAGGGLLEAWQKFASENGHEEISPNFAQRGDVVYWENDKGHLMGVVSLSGRTFLTATNKGMLEVPISKASKAWRI